MAKKRGSIRKEEKAAKKAKKEVKPEWELAVDELALAVGDEVNRCPEGDVFASLAPKLFSILKEDRTQTINNLIQHFSNCVSDARVNLLKYQEEAESEVNRFDEVKQAKFVETQELEKKISELTEKIKELDQAKEMAESELDKALDEKVEEETRFETEQEKYDSLEEIKIKMEKIRDEHCHKYLTATANSKERERAQKAFGELLKMDLWKEETTLLSYTAKHALFKEVSDRTEFEQFALKYLFDKFDTNSQIIAKKLEDEKPDDTNQTRLREVHAEKSAALDQLQSLFDENKSQLKQAEKKLKKHLEELKKLPELLEEKKAGLEVIQDTIDNFAQQVEGNFHKLVERTDIKPEVIEEVEEEKKVEIKIPAQDDAEMQDATEFKETVAEIEPEPATVVVAEPVEEYQQPDLQYYQQQEVQYYQQPQEPQYHQQQEVQYYQQPQEPQYYQQQGHWAPEGQQLPTEYEQVEMAGKAPETEMEMQLDASQSGPHDTHEAAIAR